MTPREYWLRWTLAIGFSLIVAGLLCGLVTSRLDRIIALLERTQK